MALFSMRVQVISRGAGRSAVAAAAYRAGASLEDAQGNEFDYTGKEHVELARIMAPSDAPAWVSDRGELWRRAEAAEKRKDAQLCREIRIMIPREFDPGQRINILSDFVRREFVDRGMIADVAWHNPQASDGQRNPHAHIMLTMRPITAEGFGKKSEGGRATQKRTTDWNKRELYESIRKAWEDTANAALHQIGSEERIDRRSYAERGIDKVPQPYLGVASRVRKLKARFQERYNQWIAYRATSRARVFAQQALEAQSRTPSEKTFGAAALFDRFATWADGKVQALSSPPHHSERQHFRPPPSSDQGYDR